MATAQTADFQLVEELQIGRIEGAGADLFGQIDDISVDPDGRIYVIDRSMKVVRLFDDTGEFVREIAPEGDGPGERRYQTSGAISTTLLTWDWYRGWLWIDNGRQMQVMDSLGVELRRGTIWRNPYVERGPSSKLFHVDAKGRVYAYQRDSARDSVFSWIARGVSTSDSDVRLQDTLLIDARALIAREPVTSTRILPDGFANMTMILHDHERPEHTWTASHSGTIWISVSTERQLHELTLTGDTLRTIPVDAYAAELDVSPEGWIWFRRETGEGVSTWDLFDNCGELRGTVSVSYPVLITEVASGGLIYVVWSDDFEINYIKRLRLEGDATRSAC